MPTQHAILTLLSLTLTLTALALLLLSLRGTPLRRTPPRRCPRCWYDLATTRTCPECGHIARTDRHLHKRRRSRKLTALALTLLLTAYLPLSIPRIRARGWIGAIPTTALVLLPPYIRDDATPDLFYAVLDEVPERRLWAIHRELLLRSCLWGHAERTPGTDKWYCFEGSLLHSLTPDGRFSLSQQRRLWTALAPTLLPSRANWPADVPIRLGPLCCDCWDFTLFEGEHNRELRATLSVPELTLSLPLDGWTTEPAPWTSAPRSALWHDDTTDLGVHPPGTTIQARYQIIEDGRILWDHTTNLLTVIDTTPSDLLTPVPTPDGTDTCAELLDPRHRLSVSSRGVHFTPDPNAIMSVLRGGAFAVAIEVCRDGAPLATGYFWISPKGYCMTFSGFYEDFLIPLTGDLTPLLTAPANDPSWTVRLRGDPKTALRDPTATHYWAGEFTLTRDQFTVYP